MIRYQVVLECDYCHDREIDEGSKRPPEDLDWGHRPEPWVSRDNLDFCCEGHMTAYLEAHEKPPPEKHCCRDTSDGLFECHEDDEGRLWIGSGAEYDAEVICCPFCGYKALT